MSWTRTLNGRDLVAALVIGGFRVARREDGLALLVRDGDEIETVVVREDSVVEARRVGAILARAGLGADELEGWLAAAASSEQRTVTKSGFQRRIAPADVEDAIARSRDLLRRITIKK